MIQITLVERNFYYYVSFDIDGFTGFDIHGFISKTNWHEGMSVKDCIIFTFGKFLFLSLKN